MAKVVGKVKLEDASMVELKYLFNKEVRRGKVDWKPKEFSSEQELIKAKEQVSKELAILRGLTQTNNVSGIYLKIVNSLSSGKFTYYVNVMIPSSEGAMVDENQIWIEYTCSELSLKAIVKTIAMWCNRNRLEQNLSYDESVIDNYLKKIPNSLWIEFPKFHKEETLNMLKDAGVTPQYEN